MVETENKFIEILLIARRAVQLVRGDEPKLNIPGAKVSWLADQEFKAGLLDKDALLQEVVDSLANKKEAIHEEDDDYSVD